jgi:hypothetical protein
VNLNSSNIYFFGLRGLEALRKTRMRKSGDKNVSETQRAYNRYVTAATLLTDAAPETVLDLYRQRRQIELAFKLNRAPGHGSTGNCYWQPSVKHGLTEGVFPPLREGAVDTAWPLWNEQRLMLVVVKYILLEAIPLTNLFKNIHRLAELCTNSKRKRFPAFYRLLIPK